MNSEVLAQYDESCEWAHLQDTISLGNFDEILMNLSGAVRGAAMNEQEQTTSNLAMVTAGLERSAQLVNEMIVIQNTVSLLILFLSVLVKKYVAAVLSSLRALVLMLL